MAHEIDGNGNIRIHTFSVKCFLHGDLESETKYAFSDYTDGWNWARRIEDAIESSDPDFGTDDAYTIDIDVDSDWMSFDAWEDLKESQCEEWTEY